MYKVGGLVKKRFDKLSGQSTITFENSLNNYTILSTPIFITDKSYDGAIDIPIIDDVNDFKGTSSQKGGAILPDYSWVPQLEYVNPTSSSDKTLVCFSISGSVNIDLTTSPGAIVKPY